MAALVLVGLVILGVLFVWLWLEDRERSARMIEQSSTQEGPVLPETDAPVRGMLIERLRKIPSIEGSQNNGLRFVAAPSFSTTDYAVAVFLPDGADEATGVLVFIPKTEEARAIEKHFSIPVYDYAALINEIHWLTEDWILLGHTNIENTVRYPVVYVDDALTLSERTDV